jgi:hypothetical protein
MTELDKPRYWFRPKSYGYGATPITWEGWAVSIGVGAVVAGSIIVMLVLFHRDYTAGWIVWAVAVAGLMMWFVRLCRARTDGEWRWRWGRRANERFGR